jgi:hypothetical protein
MKPAPFEYHAPPSVEEMIALLARYGENARPPFATPFPEISAAAPAISRSWLPAGSNRNLDDGTIPSNFTTPTRGERA